MRVLNFGSMNIDCVYQMDHFIQPGETYASTSLNRLCGGKGLNQSIALAQAGMPVFHACKVGADGDFLVEKLKEKGVDTRYIAPGEGSSGHAIIQVTPDGQNAIILFGGTNQQMDRAYIDQVLAEFSTGDVLVLQNELNLTGYMIEKASARGMLVAFNAAPFTDSVESYPLEKLTWLVVNEVEGAQLAQCDKPEEILERLHHRYPQVNLLLTLGKQGCLYCDRSGEITKGRSISVKAVDTTAAGDTHFSYFLRAILDGSSPQEALNLAAVASGIAVTRPGAADSVPAYSEVVQSPYFLQLQEDHTHAD